MKWLWCFMFWAWIKRIFGLVYPWKSQLLRISILRIFRCTISMRKMNEHDISIRFPPEISSVRGWGSKMILSKNGTWICMGGIASMDGLLNALTMAITCHYNHDCEIIRVLATWGPGPLMRWGNIFYMFTDCRGCFCWWFLPGMLACLRFRCKIMRTKMHFKQQMYSD